MSQSGSRSNNVVFCVFVLYFAERSHHGSVLPDQIEMSEQQQQKPACRTPGWWKWVARLGQGHHRLESQQVETQPL